MFRRRRSGDDFAEEIRAHLALETDALRAEGLTEAEAQRIARVEFGSRGAAQERFYQRGQVVWFQDSLRALRYGLRQLLKSPGFTLVVVLMLALGIGANTAVFSVMNAILMEWLPVRNPEGLFYVRMANGEWQPPGASNTGNSSTSFSERAFEELRQRKDVFKQLIAYVPLSLTGDVAVRHGELPEVAEGEEVSGNFFSGLEARLAFGRGFTLTDEKGHAPIVVLSYDYWTRSFARDSDVLGKTLYIKSVPMTVVGVAARGFKGVEPATDTDFWIPLQNRPELNAWGATWASLYGSPKWWCLRLMARLQPG